MDISPLISDFHRINIQGWVLFLVFLFFALIQLGFYIFRFSRLGAYKPKVLEANNNEDGLPDLSVVICCRNERQKIEELLNLLSLQTYKHKEIIVVDDRSGDEVYDYLLDKSLNNDFRLKLVRVNYTPDHIDHKKFALTMGIKAASSQWIVLTDADCLPKDTRWLESYASLILNQPRADIILGYCGYAKTEISALNTISRFDAFFTAVQYISAAISGKTYMGVGRNMAYKKSLFIDNNGFAEHYSITGGDDDLFINRLAGKSHVSVLLNNESFVITEPKDTFRKYIKQKIRHLHVGKYYKFRDKVSHSLFVFSLAGFYFTFIWLLFWWPLTFLVAGTFVIRTLIQTFILIKAGRRLQEDFSWWQLILLDVYLLLHYIFIGIPALIIKKIEWK